MSVAREDAFYRRGTVLGLTLAEIMLLLLFVLLLALSFLVQNGEREVAAVRQELTEQQNQVRALTAQLAAAGVQKQQQKAFNDVFIELQLAKGELERKDKLVADLSGKLETMKDAPEKAASWDSLERELGGPQDPKKLAERLLTTRESAAVAEAVKGSGLPMEPKELAQKLADLRELEKLAVQALGDKAKAEERLDYFKRRAGLGNELPSCWINAGTKQAEYLYDVVLGSTGIVVHDRAPEYRRPEMAKLPIDGVAYGKVLGQRDFYGMFRPLYDWSEQQQCRFFVRAFDRTEAHEKEVFKGLLRSVEGFFYKYLVVDRSIQPGQKDG